MFPISVLDVCVASQRYELGSTLSYCSICFKVRLNAKSSGLILFHVYEYFEVDNVT